ncbi:MAG TPA: hypothetical protein VG365_14345 [Solirubrobacteraceae bacterium]|nr:hypothetical protein [Solirubrobacteraceae bacterium]
MSAATAAALALGSAGAASAARPLHHGIQRNQRALRRQLALLAYAKSPRRGKSAGGSHSPGDNDLADQMAQYDYERTAPAAAVSGQALISADQQAGGLQSLGGPWQDVTNRSYNGQPSNYTDPFWSNVGAGFSLVGGRTTALAQTPDGAWFAGTADGGVWRSTDQGRSWSPVFDSMPSLSSPAVNWRWPPTWGCTRRARARARARAGSGSAPACPTRPSTTSPRAPAATSTRPRTAGVSGGLRWDLAYRPA